MTKLFKPKQKAGLMAGLVEEADLKILHIRFLNYRS